MPTYSYACAKCGTEYEKLQKMSDKTRAKCPQCGTRGERLITGGSGFVFKGSGFYATDYKKAAEPPKSEPKTDESKGDGKQDSKSSKSSDSTDSKRSSDSTDSEKRKGA